MKNLTTILTSMTLSLALTLSAWANTAQLDGGQITAELTGATRNGVEVVLKNRSQERLERLELMLKGPTGVVIHRQPLLQVGQTLTLELKTPEGFEPATVEFGKVGRRYQVWMPLEYRPAPDLEPRANVPGSAAPGKGQDSEFPRGYETDGAAVSEAPSGLEQEGRGKDEADGSDYRSQEFEESSTPPTYRGPENDDRPPRGYEEGVQ